MTAPATLFSGLAPAEDTTFTAERRSKAIDPTVLKFAETVKAGTPQVLAQPETDKAYRQVVSEFNRAAASMNVKFSYAKGTGKNGAKVFRVTLAKADEQPAETKADETKANETKADETKANETKAAK